MILNQCRKLFIGAIVISKICLAWLLLMAAKDSLAQRLKLSEDWVCMNCLSFPAKREEEIFVEGAHESIMLSKDSDALKLIQRIRDEAHRFAITYHRKLRGKRNLVSILDHIEGIGPKRREALWKHFGSLEAIKTAETKDLAGVAGMNKASAQKIYDFFRMDLEAKRETIL